ncbi:MAG: hypothetical protein ACRD96_00575 [Bryobacteraceae bacterium]
MMRNLPAVALLLFATACARQPAFKPVATVKQLMQATIDPAADVLFEAVGTVISVEGVEEIAPGNDEEWAEVQHAALTLAEAGNLLLIGDRPNDKKDKGDDWTTMSQALVDAGVVALKAAEAKNPESLFEAGGKIYEVCQQCHNRYWKEGRPEAFR